MLPIQFGNHKSILRIGLNQKHSGLPIKMLATIVIYTWVTQSSKVLKKSSEGSIGWNGRDVLKPNEFEKLEWKRLSGEL